MIKENPSSAEATAGKRVSKYLLYAIGEIVLVVIGILIALNINTWNSERIVQKNIRNYYERIHVEIEGEIKRAQKYQQEQAEIVEMNRRSLEILDAMQLDSIDVLKNDLGALGTVWVMNYTFPIIDEFLAQGYLAKIGNDSIKMGFKTFSQNMKRVKENDEYTWIQYIHTIEPFFNKNINYSRVALPEYKARFIVGGPATKEIALFGNLELWNVLTFKLENLVTEAEDLEYMITHLEWLNAKIIDELERE